MTILDAVLQGILQGLTEFLPVSSSGHLSLYQYFTGNSGETAFLLSILLHAGTLVAVCVCFYKEILRLIYEFLCIIQDIFHRRGPAGKPHRMPPERRTVIMLILSTLPLAFMLLLKDRVEQFSTDNNITVEGFCFLLTAILLFLGSGRSRGRKNGATITWQNALAVGAAQVAATMPGISRSGSTISTGLLCGFEREYAVSYSFIMGIPAVFGAIILELKDLGTAEGLPAAVLLTGFFTAVIFGILSIKLVQWLVRGNKFRIFAYYTLVLGIVVLIIGFIDSFTSHAVQEFFIQLAGHQ
ncbi:MAG: undecaprenyl-diphosphate phosphatase [Oscillospiraceae bacterium]|nr:undecaprenyl-diphosphate phosphatase [Oscillospiraceae bacterium]MCI9364454.1 undecaprenyl-diphosphate phosphatase [Oscillospiraceae bacterium]